MARRLGVVGGAIVGLLVSELIDYFVHRAAHRFSFMWRWMHQMHHAPQRIDLASSAVFHPFEMMFQNVFGMGIGVLVLGIDPLAGAILGYIGALLGMFQHLNVRTPQWLGYIIQRPEAHCIHHQLNVHAYNYGNITVWDIVFGTFRTPRPSRGASGSPRRHRSVRCSSGETSAVGSVTESDQRRVANVGNSEVMA